MIKQVILIGCLAAGAAEARQQNLAQLAPSQFADTEVSTNVPYALDLPSLKEYRITLAWDCGEWSARGIRDWGFGIVEMPLVTSGPDTNGFVVAEIAVAVSNHKSKPAWLYDQNWNLVRVTRRGIDDTQERVSIYTRVAGTLILVR